MGILGSSKNTRMSHRRSTSTQLVLFWSKHSISATYDHRRHPQESKTSIIIPNTIIAFRSRCKWIFGVSQKILKQLMECLHQHSLLFVSRLSSSTTYDHRSHSKEPRTSIITPNTIITLSFCCNWVFGSRRKY